MKLSMLETLVLSNTSDDYESIGWLTKERSEEVGFEVDEDMVAECLRRMASEGLVDVFHYDPNNQKQEFVPSSFEEGKPLEELWFYISEDGRKAVEENWDESWNLDE